MNKLQSADGTTSAFDRVGQGPATILVDGALLIFRQAQHWRHF